MEPLPQLLRDELTRLIPPDRPLNDLKFLLAVSGGMDSMVMTHCFQSLGLSCGVAHFNFQLRGEESDLDEQLIREYCEKNNIPFHVKTEDTSHTAKLENLSIQEMARKLRYDFFEEIMEHHKYEYVCTAHHGNDQLETFFIHLFRGSGLKGLTGIPQKREDILRPMLWIPHTEFERYTAENNIEYRDDSSNKSDKYLRNWIRHHIIQPLTDKSPNHLIKSLDSINILNEYQDYINIQISEFGKKYVTSFSDNTEKISLSKETFDTPGNLFLLKLYLLEQGLYPDNIRGFINACGDWKTGSVYEGNSVNAWFDRDNLWIIKDSFYDGWDKNDIVEISPEPASVELPGGDQIDVLNNVPSDLSNGEWIISVNQEQVTLPLRMRHRQPGDHIEMGAPPYYRKSLKKLFNDYSIPRPFKDRLYVLTDAEDRIIAIPGLVNSPKYTSVKKSDMVIQYNSSLAFI